MWVLAVVLVEHPQNADDNNKAGAPLPILLIYSYDTITTPLHCALSIVPILPWPFAFSLPL